jgi:DNA-directed RNA polymerase specialized sigma24 family protein
VVTLCELSDLSHREIGELLAIPAGTVGSRRHRALGILRRRLEDED